MKKVWFSETRWPVCGWTFWLPARCSSHCNTRWPLCSGWLWPTLLFLSPWVRGSCVLRWALPLIPNCQQSSDMNLLCILHRLLISICHKKACSQKKNKNKEKNIWHQNKKRKFIMRLMLLKHATSFLLWPQWFFRPSRWKSKPLNPNSSPSIFDASPYLTKKELFCPAKLPSSSALETTFIFNSMLSAMLVPPFDRASFLLSLTKSYPHVSVQSQVPQAPHAAATAGLVCGL